jgi:hypothetical protein
MPMVGSHKYYLSSRSNPIFQALTLILQLGSLARGVITDQGGVPPSAAAGLATNAICINLYKIQFVKYDLYKIQFV